MNLKKFLSNVITLTIIFLLMINNTVVIYASNTTDKIHGSITPTLNSIDHSNFSQQCKVNMIDSEIPIEATNFARNNYKNVLIISQPYYNQLVSSNWNMYSLGTPYVIYNPTEKIWDEVYYYPIIYNNEIVLVISIINTSNGWTLSATDDIIDGLNEINYSTNNTFLFCEVGEQIRAISQTEAITILGNKENCIYNTQEQQFEKASYFENVTEISKKMQKMKPININQRIQNTYKSTLEGYMPSYNLDRTSGSDVGRICSLYNAQGQGNLPICWAATVATIVNYRLGTNHTAKDVCDLEGTGYKAASIDVKKAALKDYGLTYKKTNKQLSWSKIIQNIDSKYPIAASTFDSNGNGHATLIHGYRFKNATKYVVMYNPGTKSTQTVMYRTSGTTYTYNGKTWTWTKSLSNTK